MEKCQRREALNEVISMEVRISFLTKIAPILGRSYALRFKHINLASLWRSVFGLYNSAGAWLTTWLVFPMSFARKKRFYAVNT